jgi:3-oxoacyl-[acyl-carrier-protein] synthase II
LSSRPFDKDRSGMVLGEGAVAALLTAARPQDGLGMILGYASRHGGASIVAPCAQTAAATIRACLSNAGIEAEEIMSINAHGTSTPVNEEIEAEALSQVFSKIPPVTANKGATGHLSGASGVLDAVIAAWSAHTGVIPPTAGTAQVDLPVDVVICSARTTRPGPVLSNAFAFGGQNTALILGPLTAA